MSATTSDGARIEVRGLTKRFGSFVAVDDLSFDVEPGRITGFLGPNGAGKTTTLRMILGLVNATSGTATIDGHRYVDLPNPLGTVGAALEATNFHPGRSGRDHLRVLADAGSIPLTRVDELLELTGIPAAARKRAGEYSMGMRQRLGLAAALLGDPKVLVLDEPSNDVDTDMLAALEDLLDSWPGTLLVVSHDRYFVERVTDQQYAIIDGRLRHLPGGVDEYLLLRSADRAAEAGAKATPDAATEAAKASAAEVRAARKELSATERKLDRLAERVVGLHQRLATHDHSDYPGLARLDVELKAAEAEITDLEERWLELSELAD